MLAEHRLTVHDPDAGVVVIAKTDLLYQDSDGWVLRETKTTRHADDENLLVSYPQVALGIVLLAEGIPGGRAFTVSPYVLRWQRHCRCLMLKACLRAFWLAFAELLSLL